MRLYLPSGRHKRIANRSVPETRKFLISKLITKLGFKFNRQRQNKSEIKLVGFELSRIDFKKQEQINFLNIQM
jgi:hypothetical protein